VEKLHMYIQVHQYKEQGFSISAAIAKKLDISRNESH
jgi:hypothetical protein